jgi:hypothetical protein
VSDKQEAPEEQLVGQSDAVEKSDKIAADVPSFELETDLEEVQRRLLQKLPNLPKRLRGKRLKNVRCRLVKRLPSCNGSMQKPG